MTLSSAEKTQCVCTSCEQHNILQLSDPQKGKVPTLKIKSQARPGPARLYKAKPAQARAFFGLFIHFLCYICKFTVIGTLIFGLPTLNYRLLPILIYFSSLRAHSYTPYAIYATESISAQNPTTTVLRFASKRTIPRTNCNQHFLDKV